MISTDGSLTFTTTGSGNIDKELHHHFANKRVLKYEVFENLNEADIEYIMNKLGNGINIKL